MAARSSRASWARSRLRTYPGTRDGEYGSTFWSFAASDVGVPATAIAARAAVRTSAGTAAATISRTSARIAATSAGAGGADPPGGPGGGRGVGSHVALGLADGARLGRDVEAHAVAVADDELGRAAADVDDDDGPDGAGGPLARRAPERQARLLVARDRARVETELVADAPGEVRAVGGVADGARQDRDRALRAELVDRGAVLPEDGDDALDRLGREAAAGIHAPAEAGDDGAPLELGDRAGRRVDVGDEQARRVRAEVDDRDAGRAARAQRSSG